MLDVLHGRENPLSIMIKEMDIHLEYGGFFIVRNVIDQGYLVDYEILVKNLESQV